MQASANVNASQRDRYKDIVANPATQPAEKVEEAKRMLARFYACDADLKKAQDDVITKLGDKRWTGGFGSNGGEEFLSYLNIGESLFISGGPDWTKWDTAITTNLNGIQNEDGSWAGQHCITGKTFCTSAAMMALMVDRAPVATTLPSR